MNTLQQVGHGGKCVRVPVVRGGYGGHVGGGGRRIGFGQGVWRNGGRELQKLWVLSNGLGMHKDSKRRPWRKVSASLGFTADPRVGIERAANGLLKDAAMLLLYQEVFRSPPAQAFLKVLLALRRGDDGLKLLESYGEFFKLMAIGRYPSWEDYILEGILSGEKNPFAEAAANVGNPRSSWSGGIPPSLRAASAADLDSLQRLSITESTLSGWVAEMVADVRPEWRAAAASNFSCKTVSKSSAGAEEGSNIFGFSLSVQPLFLHGESMCQFASLFVEEPKLEDLGGSRENSEHTVSNPSTSEVSDITDPGAPGQYTKSIRTFIHEDREKWRKKIGGLWRWSEAVPLLENYYADHSVGRVASTQFLQWKGGKITVDPRWVTKTSGVCDLSIQKVKKDALLKNLTRHAQRCPSHHVLLYGPSGIGKTWLVRSVLSEVSSSKDLHILTLPVAEFKSIYTVLEELARHWQLRFVLVIDDLLSRGGEDNYAFLKSALDGNVQEWPDNVIMCATSVRKVGVQAKDGAVGYGDLGHLFGMTLRFDDLEVEDYLLCVSELVGNRKAKTSFETTLSTEVIITQAKSWAQNLGVWSVRSAAQFVNALT